MLTVVVVGICLPELAVCVVAAVKRQTGTVCIDIPVSIFFQSGFFIDASTKTFVKTRGMMVYVYWIFCIYFQFDFRNIKIQ